MHPQVKNNGLTLIAGHNNIGFKVYASARAYAAYQHLTKEVKAKNYWAHLIIKGIQGLNSGMITSNDVFVQTTDHKHGSQDFVVVLPGCTVYAERRNKAEYVISRLEVSEDYFERQKDGDEPSLHKTTFMRNGWQVDPIPNNAVKIDSDIKVVGIGDKAYRSREDAAKLVGDRIKASVNPAVRQTGYNLFHTPGKGRLGGLHHYRQAMHAETDTGLHESAYLLAEVMGQSQAHKNITWFADFGGSGILTQAMQILSDRGVSLTGHSLYLYRPTTRTDTAYQLSQAIGLSVDRDFVRRNNLNLNEVVGSASLTLPCLRRQNEAGYTRLNMTIDYVKGFSGGKTVVKTAMAIGAAAGSAAAFPALATMSAMVIAVDSYAAVGVAAIPIAMAHAPNFVDRLKARF